MSASSPRPRPAARSASIPARDLPARRTPTTSRPTRRAFWDTVNNPAVVSSSFSIFQQTNPCSVFANAVKELFIDCGAAQHHDGAGQQRLRLELGVATGLANQAINSSSPFMLLVGGTSLTTLAWPAAFDPTIASDPSQARRSTGRRWRATRRSLWRLVEGGLTQAAELPPSGDGGRARTSSSNRCGTPSSCRTAMRTPKLGASDGGVDTSQPTPWYQTQFGLTPTSVNPGHATGRGAPGRLGQFRRQHVLPDAGQGHARDRARRGNQCGDAAVGLADGPGRHDLRRPGAAASGLRQRSPVYRRRDRAGVVQRHHLRQQRHVLHQRRTGADHRRRRQSHHAHRLRLLRRPRLRPDDGAGLAQRHVAGAGDDGDRPFADVVQLQPGHARRRWDRLAERRRPEPDVPDHVGLADQCGNRYRHVGLRLLEHGVRHLRLDQPAGTAGAAVRLRSPPGAPVRQAGAGLGRAIRRRGGRTSVGLDQRASRRWRSRRR